MIAGGSGSRWAALLAKFLGVNVFVQAVALVVGVLIVRGLPQATYGYYAVVTSLIAAFILLSDSGLTGAFIAAAAPQRRDRSRVASLLHNSIRLQRLLSVLIGAMILCALGGVLVQLGASIPVLLAAAVAVAFSLLPLANKSMYQALHRLNGNYSRLQVAALLAASFRLIAIGSVTLIFGLDIYIVLAVLVAAFFIEAVSMQWGMKRIYPPVGSVDAHLRTSQLVALRRTMPASLTIVAQTQIVTILIGLVGGAIVLAEVSALSRFALVLAVFAGVATDLGLGAVARSGASNREILRTMGFVVGAFLLVGSAAVAVLGLLAPQLLWLLGPEYSGLEIPLLIVGIGTVGIMAADLLRQLNQARGWTRSSWVFVPLTLAWLAVGVFLLDLSQVEHAAFWMALQAVTGGITQVIVLSVALWRARRGDATA